MPFKHARLTQLIEYTTQSLEFKNFPYFFRDGCVYRVTFTGVKQDLRFRELMTKFRRFGRVRHLHLDMNPVLDIWSGTGHVDFYSEEAAERASDAEVIRIRDSTIRMREYDIL